MHRSIPLALLLAVRVAAAQSVDLTGAADTSVFAPLPLPPGTETRSASGAPGHRYWQNRADYALTTTLDTATATLTGGLRLRYTNNSPDTLTFLWLQVEQNYFARTAKHTQIFQGLYGARNFDGGETIDRLDLIETNGHRRPLTYRTQDTEMQVSLPAPLAPGRTVVLDIAWHFPIATRIGGDRMGRDGTLYAIAQWYPRMNVYDDLRGWNTEAYLGPSEFYLEYGDFRYAVTVPAGYIVAGTGVLDNPTEVLTATERQRLAIARTANKPVAIITAEEAASGASRPRHDGMLTWRFHADRVRDVAWITAPDYRWDAVGWHGLLMQAFYRPGSPASWTEAADMTRASIEEYSRRWYPYPYPQMTAAEGPVDGMEYPMLAMESAHWKSPEALYRVLTHETGHYLFPMVVGSNERIHAWMDEGFNQFMNTFAEAERYPNRGDQAARITEYRDTIVRRDSVGIDDPVETPHDRESLDRTDVTFYYKPAYALDLLRREILAPDVFDSAFRTYVRRWAYKHPAPADFFRTMENTSGQRLDWFWREFFLENRHFDQAIDSVGSRTSGDTTFYLVIFGNHARGVLPILVRFSFSDGSTIDYAYPVDVWGANASRFRRLYRFPNGRRVTRIELDPDHRLIDLDRGNNVWSSGGT